MVHTGARFLLDLDVTQARSAIATRESLKAVAPEVSKISSKDN